MSSPEQSIPELLAATIDGLPARCRVCPKAQLFLAGAAMVGAVDRISGLADDIRANCERVGEAPPRGAKPVEVLVHGGFDMYVVNPAAAGTGSCTWSPAPPSGNA